MVVLCARDFFFSRLCLVLPPVSSTRGHVPGFFYAALCSLFYATRTCLVLYVHPVLLLTFALPLTYALTYALCPHLCLGFGHSCVDEAEKVEPWTPLDKCR